MRPESNPWYWIVRRADPQFEEVRRDKLEGLRARRRPEDYARWKKYHLSVTEYSRIFAQQNGVCAICREPDHELCVDHDHKTGRVRALLCGGCNSAIGFLRESPLLARVAATYLEQQLTKECTGE